MKDLIKPPFANYDVVVYFGGGLFTIPFINRYLIEPSKFQWPKFEITISSSIANEVVSGLSLLFCIYILGHLIAYLGSQLIEKLSDRILGKISTAILISSWSSSHQRNENIRALIFNRFRALRKDGALFTTFIRAAAHLPVLPIYGITFLIGIFGYYDTRVPYSIMTAARHKMPSLGLGDVSISIRSKWYKPLEYWVINRNPAAVVRMYNYLVIGGLFRTLAMVFLMSLWAQLYYLLHFWADGDWFLQPFLGSEASYSAVVEYLLMAGLYTFSLFSYLKFQRRYAEEAIFAFVLGQEQVSPPQDPQ